ncbi:MAG TPA: EthD domain-containing protein [Xenococcaceae cyanobacterium]
MGSTIKNTNYVMRDRHAAVTFYVLLWKRKGIELDVFDDYWRNVHGPVCARLPGQYQYWQYHLSHNRGGLWPTIEGIEYNSLPEAQFDGIAELTFTSEADRQTWFKAAAILMNDEHNIFSKAVGYNTSSGNSQTYGDRIETGTPNGKLGILKFHVMVKKADGVSIEEFRQYLKHRFAPSIAQSDLVLKFRLHLFEEIDNSRPDAAGVSHFESPQQQYQAAFEIAFTNALEREQFFVSPEYEMAVKNLTKYVKQISPFPERTAYTFVYNSQITLAGQRSSTVAELIAQVGATNQLKEDIISLMSGTTSVTNGKQNGHSDLSVSDTKDFLSTTTDRQKAKLERLPGTASDLVKCLFARGEAFDSEGFVEFFTDTPVYQVGSFELCLTKAAIKKSTAFFFSQLSALYHEIKSLWEIGDVVLVEMDVIYWRKDGAVFSLPCCDIFRLEGDKFSELRIFIDANALSDPKISVPYTASVLTTSEGKRLTPPGIMKQFFTENPEGKARVAAGFVPTWSQIASKWSIS